MVATREEAARRAEASRANVPGTCQLWTRTQYGAPSAGDQDHDGDADAVDGWKSEPVSARHTDRHPPRGVPVAWSGGSHGFGHRAISLGRGKIRSTDANGSGWVGTVDLSWPEEHWGLHYLGWSDTIDGLRIPEPTPPTPPKKPRRPRYVADYSTARPDPKALKAAGFRGVMRYVSPPGGIKKDLTVSEAKALHAAGLWISLIFESTAGRAGEGSVAGSFDAATAEAAADKLGHPDDATIFYAVDYDASPAAVSAYFTGVKDAAKRPVGIYGGVRVIDAGLADAAWQTEAWSGGKVSRRADMLQHTKPSHAIPAGVDENVLLHRRRRGFKVWKPAPDAPAPAPKPAGVLTGGTFNLEFGRDRGTVADEVTRALTTYGLHFLAVQEAGDYLAELETIPGYTYVVDKSSHGTAQVGILVRDDVTVTHPVFRSLGDGWKTVTGKDHAAALFPRVTLDGWLRVGATHMPTPLTWHDDTIEGPKERIDDYLAVAKKVKRFLAGRLHPSARIVAADWNETPATLGAWSPHWIADQVGASIDAPPSHHGHHAIDYPVWIGCKVTNLKKRTGFAEGSDHDLVTFNVERP